RQLGENPQPCPPGVEIVEHAGDRVLDVGRYRLRPRRRPRHDEPRVPRCIAPVVAPGTSTVRLARRERVGVADAIVLHGVPQRVSLSAHATHPTRIGEAWPRIRPVEIITYLVIVAQVAVVRVEPFTPRSAGDVVISTPENAERIPRQVVPFADAELTRPAPE